MTTTMASGLTTYRCSSADEPNRSATEDPAPAEVITIAQGGAAPTRSAGEHGLIACPREGRPACDRRVHCVDDQVRRRYRVDRVVPRSASQPRVR
jgi:hypothetical protein